MKRVIVKTSSLNSSAFEIGRPSTRKKFYEFIGSCVSHGCAFEVSYDEIPDIKKTVNYIAETQGWDGKEITECETKEEVWKAFGNCAFGSLTTVSSPTGMDCSDFIPY